MANRIAKLNMTQFADLLPVITTFCRAEGYNRAITEDSYSAAEQPISLRMMDGRLLDLAFLVYSMGEQM